MTEDRRLMEEIIVSNIGLSMLIPAVSCQIVMQILWFVDVIVISSYSKSLPLTFSTLVRLDYLGFIVSTSRRPL